VATPIELSDLALGEQAAQFQGKDHGAQVSFFVTTHAHGAGPDLHTHPYEETFLVEEGRVRFTVDGEAVDAHAGQIVVVPAGVAHGFKGAGRDVPVRIVSIHPAPEMVTTWLGRPALPPA
jgi:quercetin dioxygenase-like cupin family protein